MIIRKKYLEMLKPQRFFLITTKKPIIKYVIQKKYYEKALFLELQSNIKIALIRF